MKNQLKSLPIIKVLYNSLINYPSPTNINLLWNMGFMLGICLMIQIISGLMLSFHYCPNVDGAFNSIIHMNHNVNYGIWIHHIHMNGASLFFLSIYIHIGRNLFYSSYFLIKTWLTGIVILFSLMGTAFLGYVLPWGQMSFWGATVITNLISTIPYIGFELVKWLWGGFSVSNPTLNRFYSFHFVLPFVMILFIFVHLTYLHETGSNNPLGSESELNMIPFYPYFSSKDLMSTMIIMLLMSTMILINPYFLSDPENFIKANPMMTPIHIQPEWYFLFAYSILRAIPNKFGGVISLIMSIMILLIPPIMAHSYKFKSNKFLPMNNFMFWMFSCSVILLTWTGANPVEPPFIKLSQMLTVFHFSYFIFTHIYNVNNLIFT